MLGGQPDGLDVLREGDLATGVVVPRSVADFGLLPVPGAFGGASGGVGAGGALPAFGVAVAGDEPLERHLRLLEHLPRQPLFRNADLELSIHVAASSPDRSC